MKMSRRAKRMALHHKRHKGGASLNMISLMDIFTILVFFLLVSSSAGEVLPNTKKINLPESDAEKLPKETLTIIVNSSDILLQGQKIVDVESVLKSKKDVIEPLKEILDLHAGRMMRRMTDSKKYNGQITIMGDKTIPYKLLKKIMVTSTSARYGNISFAVLRKIDEKGV